VIYEVTEGKETMRVELHESGENVYDVIIDGEKLRIDASKSGRTIYSLIESGNQWEAMVDERRGDKFDVTVAGRLFHLAAVDERTKLLAEAGATALSGPQTVNAEMPGKVVKIDVAVGDAVSAGQPVLIVEAMKMENPIASPIDGIVKEIGAAEGEAVDGGSLLFVVEPAPE